MAREEENSNSNAMETDEQQQQQGQEEQRQALKELDALQERVLEAVGVASRAVESLSQLEALDEAAVQEAFEDYLAIMKEVHEGLASRAHWIRNYVPYQRSAEALRQEVAVLELRLGLLKEEARRLGYREEGVGVGVGE